MKTWRRTAAAVFVAVLVAAVAWAAESRKTSPNASGRQRGLTAALKTLDRHKANGLISPEHVRAQETDAPGAPRRDLPGRDALGDQPAAEFHPERRFRGIQPEQPTEHVALDLVGRVGVARERRV